MQINVPGKKIEIQGDRVFINGKEVLSEAPDTTPKQESEVSAQARVALEGRYPNVKFIGDCSKIIIDTTVVIEGGVRIEQSDDTPIEITRESIISEGAYIFSPKSSDASFNSISISGSGVSVVSFGNGSFKGRGISIGSFNESPESRGIRISDTDIGRHAEVSGLGLLLNSSQIGEKCKVISQGSSSIEIEASVIDADVISTGSGDISIEDSRISARIQSCGSGDIKIRSSSEVRGSISVNGSGDVKVSNSIIEPKGSLTVQGSGDIVAKNCTVTKPHAVHGSDDIRLR
jgi:hypothetical protein